MWLPQTDRNGANTDALNQQSTVDKYYEGPYGHMNTSSINTKHCCRLRWSRLTFLEHRMDEVGQGEIIKGPEHLQFTNTDVFTYFA